VFGEPYEGKLARLRQVMSTDLEPFVRWLNDPDVNRWIALPKGPPQSLEAELRWFIAAQEDPAQIVWSVERRSDGELLGNAVLHRSVIHPDAAELGICLGNKALWGGGLGTDAVRTLADVAFSALGLHRVWLRADEQNPRALRAFEKAGFQKEGRVREYRRRWGDGAYVNGVVMGLLASDARPRQAERERRSDQ
jgi:RimJ/RimL family protein N-acetyltransferase